MGIDETRQQDLPGQVDNGIGCGGELSVGADFLDDAIFRIESGIFQFTTLAVHGDEDVGILSQECGHEGLLCDPSVVVPGPAARSQVYAGCVSLPAWGAPE